MIRELFIADTAFRLNSAEAKALNARRPAEERRKGDIFFVTAQSIVASGIPMIVDFGRRFVRVEMTDEGGYDFPQTPDGVYALIDLQYDGLEAETTAAMAYMAPGEYDQTQLGVAVHKVAKERLNPKDHEAIYVPPLPVDNEPDTIECGMWLAEKCVWYYGQTLALGRSSLARRTEFDGDDVVRWMESLLVEREGVNFSDAPDIGAAEGLAIDIGQLLKRANSIAFDPVELDKAERYQAAANAYYAHLRRNPEADELLSRAAMATRERAIRWAQQNRENTASRARMAGYSVKGAASA